MMDIFRRYFRYQLCTICGIPTITLRGTPDDWQRVADKVELLEPFDMPWWLEHLRPIAAQFVRASTGDVDRSHWQNICKLKHAYGGSIINGWVAQLFPYLCGLSDGPYSRRNPIFRSGEGFQTDSAPSGLSHVQFLWKDQTHGTSRLMEAIGGLVGVTQDQESLALQPIAGWVIREASQLDVLINRLKHEHDVTWRPPKEVDWNAGVGTNQDEDAELGQRVDRLLPSDLGRFYHEYESARLYADGSDCLLRILGRTAIEPVDWGEESDASTPGRPVVRVWYRFGILPGGLNLAINLDEDLYSITSRDDTYRKLSVNETFHPICIYSEATRGRADQNPVVALSFTELLSRLLDNSSCNQPYWQSAGLSTLCRRGTIHSSLAGGRMQRRSHRKAAGKLTATMKSLISCVPATQRAAPPTAIMKSPVRSVRRIETSTMLSLDNSRSVADIHGAVGKGCPKPWTGFFYAPVAKWRGESK